jgi:phospholipid/cholesterol/gamma-HCH transport system substrate-binding protein
MKLRREIKTGLLVLVSLVILIWGFHFLKGTNIFVFGAQYFGVYSRVDGLNEGSPIYYRGFRVGSVQSIGFHPTRPGTFLVSFNLSHNVPLPNNSVAQIYSVDLMGSKAVQLLEGNSNQLLSPGDTLRTNVMGDLKDQVSMEMLPLKDKTEKLLVKLDTVLTNIGMVFSEENKQGLNSAIRDFNLMMENLHYTSRLLHQQMTSDGDIAKSLHNIEKFTGDMRMQTSNLNSIMENLLNFSANLSEADFATVIAHADSTLLAATNMLNKATEGTGTLGLLMNDQGLYLNLMDATANLDRLLADLRHNPERYLHFSAINMGRRVYINADETLAEEQGIVFKVKVAESSEPLDIRNTVVLDLPVFEDTDGSNYIYTVGETNSYAEAIRIKDRLMDTFPSSSIISLKDGKPYRLKRALRKVNIKN